MTQAEMRCTTGASLKGSFCLDLPATISALTISARHLSEESEQGLSQHGEAPSSRWIPASQRTTDSEATFPFGRACPSARLQFERVITLHAGGAGCLFSGNSGESCEGGSLFSLDTARYCWAAISRG